MMTMLLDYLARNWALAAIVGTVWVLVLVPLLVIHLYARVALNAMRSSKLPLAYNPRDYEPLNGEPVTFAALDGQQVGGMIVRGEGRGQPRGAILFLHEFCSDRHSWARYCRPLQRAGYDIISFDFRGHGETAAMPGYEPSQWVTNREMNDVFGAVAWLRTWLSEQGRPPEFGMMGVSRGACAAVLAAASGDPAIRAVACDGLYSTDDCLEYLIKRYAYIFGHVRLMSTFEQYPSAFWRVLRWVMMARARRVFRCAFPSVRKALVRMTPRPLLLIHGEKDSFLPLELTYRLYALAPQPKQLWIAPGARHNHAVTLHPVRYAQTLTDFFDQHLGGGVQTSIARPQVASLTLHSDIAPSQVA